MPEAKRTLGQSVRAAVRALGRFIKRHKKLFILLAAAAVVAAVIFFVTGNMRAAAAASPPPQTTTLARMDLQQIVAGTGTLQSSVTRQVTSSLSYEIAEVYVAEGDRVDAGQLLARLDTAELDKTIANVQKSIADAQASDALALSQAGRKLQDAITTRDINREKNDKAVQEAQQTLDSAAGAVTAAENALGAASAADAAARAAADTARDTGGDPVNMAYAAWQADPSDTSLKAVYEAAWQAAYDAAYATAGGPAGGVAAAEAALAQAQSTAGQAQSARDKAAETRDTQYRTDSISVENAQDTVNTQRLKDSASSYRTQLEGHLDDLADCNITAPVGGTVTAMTAAVGQSAGGAMGGATGSASSALFTIEDTGRLEITSSVPEYDVTSISVGMPVKITSDALSDGEWDGTVKSISARAADAGGNFTVVVQLTSPAGGLAIGMSAKINIVTRQVSGVFAVPYDAVTTGAQGESVVYALDVGAQSQSAGPGRAGPGGEAAAQPGRPVAVQTGMETDYYIEITGDGLEEGMLILADPEGKNVGADETAGGFIMGGMPRGG